MTDREICERYLNAMAHRLLAELGKIQRPEHIIAVGDQVQVLLRALNIVVTYGTDFEGVPE